MHRVFAPEGRLTIARRFQRREEREIDPRPGGTPELFSHTLSDVSSPLARREMPYRNPKPFLSIEQPADREQTLAYFIRTYAPPSVNAMTRFIRMNSSS